VCLPQPHKLSAVLAGDRGTGVAAGLIRSGMDISPDASLACGRLVLVSGDDGPGDRDGADIVLRPCGSLHLPAADRVVSGHSLDGGGFDDFLAKRPPDTGCGSTQCDCGFDVLHLEANLILAD